MRISHSLSLCASLLAASSALAAQTITATPAGLNLETVEGNDQLARGWNAGRTLYFGTYAEARYQIADAELIDNKVRIMTAMAFRPDNYSNRTSNPEEGRTWSNVNLTINEFNYQNISSTFANNLFSPQQVFSGSVSWPTLANAAGGTTPAPFTAPYTFRFSSPFIASGTNALLTDFQFTGGTLSSGATWGTSRVSYTLDGVFTADNMYTGASRFPNQDNGCNDSAVTATTGARMYSGFNQFSLANVSKSNTIEIPIYTRHTAPNAPVVHAVGFKGISSGIPLGFGCNSLYLDFSTPVFYFLAVAGALPNAETTRRNLSGPRTAVNLGLEIWAQGAWTDSATNVFSLTAASRARAPNLGMTDVMPSKRMVYRYNSPSSTTGSVTSESSCYNHPICFYYH